MSIIANPVQPTTLLEVNGTIYELLFDFEAVALAEEVTDRPLLSGLRSKDINTPSIALIRAMLYACIHAKHPDVSYNDAKAMVNRKNYGTIWGKVLTAWTAGLAEPDDTVEVDPTDPTPAQS